MAVVLAIIAVLSTLTYFGVSRLRPRADMAGAASELQALLHQARQTALAEGVPVAVLLYPDYAPAGGAARGYVIVYQDACFDFFTAAPACAVSYARYDPARLTAGGNGTVQSVVLETLALPRGILVGPATGMGAGAALPAPLATVPVDTACSFCGTTGGAVEFDPSGRATFYRLSGGTVTGPLPGLTGGSVSLGYDPDLTTATGQRTLVILSASGSVEAIAGG